MVQLYLNNQLCDLYGNEEIATSYSIAPIADISSRTSAKSVSFKLPPTANNMAVVQNANVIVNNSDLPYSLIPAKLKANGLSQNLEFAQIKDVQDDITVNLYGSNIDFFRIIKGRKLKDLGNQWDHVWNLANAYASRTNTEGYIYAIIDFLSEVNITYVGVAAHRIDVRALLPSVYLHSIITKIIEDAGFTAQGNILSDPDYRSIIIPCVKFIDEITFNDTFDFTAGDTLGLDELVPLMISCDSTGILLLEGSTVTIEKIDGTQSITLRVGAEVELPSGIKSFGMLSEVVSSNGINFYAGTGSGDPASVFYVTVGDDYRITTNISLRNTNQSGGVNINIGFVYDTIYPAFTSIRSFRFGFDLTSYLQVASMLPDLKQSEVLKDLAQKAGLILQVDNQNKIVHIRQFSEIVANIPNALDWSDKVDYSEKPEIQFDSDYAQRNICKYQDDDTVIKPTGTDSEILIDNDNLEPEKVLFESPFVASEQVFRFGGVSIANIKLITDIGTADQTFEDVEPRFLVKREATFSPVFTWTDGVTDLTDATAPVTHFILTTEEAFNVGFGNNLLTNSADLIAMIQNYKSVKMLLRLTPGDINQLDHFIPVWIKLRGQLGCYFYVSEVKQFKVTSKESTDTELVKLTT